MEQQVPHTGVVTLFDCASEIVHQMMQMAMRVSTSKEEIERPVAWDDDQDLLNINNVQSREVAMLTLSLKN